VKIREKIARSVGRALVLVLAPFAFLLRLKCHSASAYL
jgi:hypothetical protein